MTVWYLVVWFAFSNSGASSQTIEFRNEASCLAALAQISAKQKGANFGYTNGVCVDKGRYNAN